VLLYRVFPYLTAASPGQPGHPLYIHPRQGGGRWDNPSLYQLFYLATAPEAAMGETFAGFTYWTPRMLLFPQLPGSERALGVYRLDEAAAPLLDLDDANALASRNIRPTHVVVKNRPRTQQMAAAIYGENQWAGIQWWSFHRPQWTVVALWMTSALAFDRVERITGHAALDDAAKTLTKARRGI
jgi:hypothetical protein